MAIDKTKTSLSLIMAACMFIWIGNVGLVETTIRVLIGMVVGVVAIIIFWIFYKLTN